jgi:hypothetical protein
LIAPDEICGADFGGPALPLQVFGRDGLAEPDIGFRHQHVDGFRCFCDGRRFCGRV